MAPPLGLSREPTGALGRDPLSGPAPCLPLEDREGGSAVCRFPRVLRLCGLAPPRPLNMTVKKIAIFGATGRTGLTTLAQAVQAGMSWGRREMSRGDQAEHPERGIVRSG